LIGVCIDSHRGRCIDGSVGARALADNDQSATIFVDQSRVPGPCRPVCRPAAALSKLPPLQFLPEFFASRSGACAHVVLHRPGRAACTLLVAARAWHADCSHEDPGGNDPDGAAGGIP
jgi:hypothetical protein